MKLLRIHLTTFACMLIAAAQSFALDTEFAKGAEVRLTKDAPLFFKNAVARTGKAGEKFVVLQHNVAAKKVFVLAKDAAGKEIALNVTEDAVELAASHQQQAQNAAPGATSKPEPKQVPLGELEVLENKYGVDNKQETNYATAAPRLEKERFYIVGNQVVQFAEGAVLVASTGVCTDGKVALMKAGRKGLSGILTFKNKNAVEGVQLSRGDFIVAIGKLLEFKDLTMVDGSSEHLPVFECVGFKTANAFFSTE